jgi:hypothetical protein
MKFSQVKKDIYYNSEKNHSFWIVKESDKFKASVWVLLPDPSTEPIQESSFGTKEEAEEYLNGISATIGLKQDVSVTEPLPSIKNAFEELLSKARMTMVRDGSGHGTIEIKMNLSINDYPLHKFIYEYKHTIDNVNAGVDEYNKYLQLKAKYEGK